MSKRTGPTRIPLFGSRIPIPGQPPLEPVRIVSPVRSKQFREITRKDIGKRVRVAEKEGVLRFVGNVHFTQGVWCGIELPNANGKNDGCVRGVRYFACPDSRGLMAPLCKVLLIDDTGFDEEEDVTSGPHSMLFGIKDVSVAKDLQRIDGNITYLSQTETIQVLNNSSEESAKRRCEGETSSPSKVLIRSDTYEALEDSNSRREIKISPSNILIRSDTYHKAEEEEASSSNCTFQICSDTDACTTFTIENLAYLNENNFPDIVNSTRILAKLDKTIEDLSSNSIEDNNETVILNSSLSKLIDVHRRKASNSRDNSSDSIGENKVSDIGNSTRILSKAEYNTSTESNETVILVGNKNRRGTFTVQDAEKKKGITSTHRRNNSSSSDGQLNDTIVKNCSFDKSGNLANSKIKPFKFSSEEFTSPPPSSIPITHSTPVRPSDVDVESSPRRRVRASPAPFSSGLEEDGTKRDSLEFEESLGILTPEQMADVTSFAGSRTPSSENIGSLPNDLQNLTTKFQCDVKSTADLGSPNLVDASTKDLSLGIIDEHMLSNFTMKSDTTMNMELPLDSVDNQSKDYTFTRLEQTPSPEDLPLDPTPVIENESKTEPTKSKTTSSFITSITSITSLDTGYQGDGEMSRPASRGPDHSPLTRRPLQRPQPRRPDPMTDSDFYTESDADNHEEHPLRGDRLARVIDGTLYGVDPQAAADIYVNNRENMDSSGIFTDIEGNTRADELSSADNENQNEIPDVSPSPSETSSKTISNDSQNNAPAVINRTPVKTETNNNNSKNSENMDVDVIEIPIKRKSPSPSSAASSPASVRSPRHTARDDTTAKKYKMPKRNVASKVKAVLESNTQQNNKEASRTPPKKTAGRWDAVMNKISKTSSEKPNLKEIKSKVFANHTSTTVRQNGTPRTPNAKLRRTRTRAETPTTKSTNIESLHSSASDLSGASPAKRMGSAKKKAEVVRVTQVLTAAKLSPRSPKKNIVFENKKNVGVTVTANDNKLITATRRPLFSAKEKKQTTTTPAKDCGRATAKGGRASPGARPPQQHRAPVTPAPKTAEALAILIQHLVFNLEAFQTPSLKKQVEKSRLASEEARFSCKQMQETLSRTQLDQKRLIEEERVRCLKDFTEIIEQHKADIDQLKQKHSEVEQRHEIMKQELISSHNEQLLKLRGECNKLQKTHEQTLEILREENDSIREEIDEKNAIIQKLQVFKTESEKLEKDYKARELNYKEALNSVNEEIAIVKAENVRIMNFAAEGKENKLQIVLAEVESLRAVLELKQTEVSELRRTLAEANQKADLLPSALDRVSILTARCEDLQSQLEQKSVCEHQLLTDNKRLQESLKEEFNHSKRLVQHNEELQWKLKQNKEVVTRVLEQAEETAFNRSLLTSSLHERHNPPKNLERTMSFRERSLSNKSYSSADGSNRSKKSKNSYDLDPEDFSPPSSPKVKGVVEKSDSVCYVLEMEESPEMIANRIVRRSFRNSTPPKTTPTKSPGNKRPRMKNNPLCLSSSASAIVPTLNKSDHARSRSASVRNGDCDTGNNHHADDVFMWETTATSTPHNHKYANEKLSEESFCSAHSSLKIQHIDLDDNYNDDDIKLPTLPSEIGRKNNVQSLPVPQHLAGEAMVSESNSEDESTASSSSGML